jgi:hypothetical protein
MATIFIQYNQILVKLPHVRMGATAIGRPLRRALDGPAKVCKHGNSNRGA